MREKLNIDFEADGERAVSPVIGVILMVAITVILAAVIGTFVLGLGDQVSNTTPQASFSAESADNTEIDAGNATVVDYMYINHEGGADIDPGDTIISLDGNEVWDAGDPSSTQIATDGSAVVDANMSGLSELSTTGTWTINASSDGGGSNGAVVDITGDYTVSLVDEPSGQIITEKEVSV